MGRIYQSAKQVIIWLGLANEHTEGAMRFLSSYEDHYYFKMERIFDDNGAVQWARRPQKSERPIFKVNEVSILDFAKRPYWTRLWIVQELIQTENLVILWGDHLLQWEALSIFNMYECAVSSEKGEFEQWRLGDLIIFATLPMNDSMYFSKVVRYFSHFRCGEPRDKVYGLLGIACDATSINIDYTKSIKEVFLDAVHAIAIGSFSKILHTPAEYYHELIVMVCIRLLINMMPDKVKAFAEEGVKYSLLRGLGDKHWPDGNRAEWLTREFKTWLRI
jgi:hypothetical protein